MARSGALGDAQGGALGRGVSYSLCTYLWRSARAYVCARVWLYFCVRGEERASFGCTCVLKNRVGYMIAKAL